MLNVPYEVKYWNKIFHLIASNFSDLGCLMNIAGRLARKGSAIEVRHFAEVLAGMTDQPAICEARKK